MAAYDEKLCMAMESLETEFGTLVPSLKGTTAQKSHPGQYSLVQIVQVYHLPLKHARMQDPMCGTNGSAKTHVALRNSTSGRIHNNSTSAQRQCRI